jgi:asparagine synthase (glutamine-hydrolysing)
MSPSGLVLAGDIRLADRSGLMDTLSLDGAAGRTWTDGALVLYAIERWGIEAALSRLYGEFALAVWDSRARRLFLALDPSLGRTLYYCRTPHLVAWSTRINAPLALPGVSRALDDRALADFMVVTSWGTTRTLYGAVDRVLPGHLTVIDGACIRTGRWWHMPVPGTLRYRTDAEVEEAARETLTRVIGDAVRAEGPVTALLTGGLDTGTIAATAAGLLAPERLTVVTRVPDGPLPADTATTYYDESPRARALAALHPTMDWRTISDDGGDWGEHQHEYRFSVTAMPTWAVFYFPWMFPVYRFMANRGSRVVLSGEIGNAFFSPDGFGKLRDLFFQLRWGTLAADLRALARAEGGSAAGAFLRHVAAPFEPPLLRRWRKRLPPSPARYGALNPAFVAELGLGAKESRGALLPLDGTALEMRRRRRIWAIAVAVGTPTACRVLSGIDYRMPLADRRIWEFFGALPMDQFLKDGIRRSLPRRLLAAAGAPDDSVTSVARGRQNGDWLWELTRQRPALLSDMPRLRASPLVRRVVNLDLLQSLLDRWPRDADAAQSQEGEYLSKLARGMELARFLAWHEGGNG